MKPFTRISMITGAVLCIIGQCSSVHAETNFSLGAVSGMTPDYSGSDDYKYFVLPLISLSWQNDRFDTSNSTSKVSYGLLDAEIGIEGLRAGFLNIGTGETNHKFSIGAQFVEGRDQDDNDALKGLGDIDHQFWADLTLEGEPVSQKGSFFFYAVKLEEELSNETNGFKANLSGGVHFTLSEQLFLRTTLSTTWANEDYMQTYYGISAAQAVTSPYSQYQAGSGLSESSLDAKLMYHLSEHWSMFTSAKYLRLMGDAADSPIVKDKGSANQGLLTLGVNYTF